MPTPLHAPFAIIAGAVVLGTFSGLAIRLYPGQTTVPSTPSSTPRATTSPAAFSTDSDPSPSPTPSAVRDQVQVSNPDPATSIRDQLPTPTPATPRSTTTRSQVSPSSAETAISFVNLPSTVRSGQSFTVTWQVTGPSGLSGSNTTLSVERHGRQQTGSARSTSNSTSTQSFGSFTTPATFDADFTFAGDPGDIEVEVTATVNGKTLSKTATINFAT